MGLLPTPTAYAPRRPTGAQVRQGKRVVILGVWNCRPGGRYTASQQAGYQCNVLEALARAGGGSVRCRR